MVVNGRPLCQPGPDVQPVFVVGVGRVSLGLSCESQRFHNIIRVHHVPVNLDFRAISGLVFVWRRLWACVFWPGIISRGEDLRIRETMCLCEWPLFSWINTSGADKIIKAHLGWIGKWFIPLDCTVLTPFPLQERALCHSLKKITRVNDTFWIKHRIV